ncbi:MAG: hypothetical protein WC798_03765 [Candidatus Paceibacterota bacterium]|jgi:hypothetical protein
MEPLAKIFGSPARLKMLRFFVFNQDSAFTPAEIMKRTKLSKEITRAELSELCVSSLLRKKGARAAARYQVNPRFEYLVALKTFIRETTNVHPRAIIGALRRGGTLQLVALSGFFTGILESQIDLLIVGDHLEERVLSHSVHALEAELGREIRYASFATADFKYRIGVYDRLLRDVFDYPHRLLIDKIGL